MTVFTLGYEGLDRDRFIALLAAHDIETVVDVRERPLSRKPGFSKNGLAGSLRQSGYAYVHMVDLGCPKPVRDRYRENGNWRRYTEDFLKYLQTRQEAIAQLSNLVGTSNCALLCYEADHNLCHRSMVANAVRDHCGAVVQHIQVAGTRKASLAERCLAIA